MANARLCAVLSVSLALFAPQYSGAAEVSTRPNIVVILVDDMGFSDIGCYGSEIPTPNLDKLAAGGLRFTQFYNTGRCCPTRASLLTGLYPHQAGVGHMTEDRGEDGYRGDLNDRCVTIAEVLRSAGYRTAMAGKWHVTKFVKPRDEAKKFNWPLQRGFDQYFGIIQGGADYFRPKPLTLRERERAARRRFLYDRRLRGSRDRVHRPGRQDEAVLPLPGVQCAAFSVDGAGGRDCQVPRQIQNRLGRTSPAAPRPANRTWHHGQSVAVVAASRRR